MRCSTRASASAGRIRAGRSNSGAQNIFNQKYAQVAFNSPFQEGAAGAPFADPQYPGRPADLLAVPRRAADLWRDGAFALLITAEAIRSRKGSAGDRGHASFSLSAVRGGPAAHLHGGLAGGRGAMAARHREPRRLIRQAGDFAGQVARGGRGLLDHRGVLLGRLVHRRDCRADLGDRDRLGLIVGAIWPSS